MAYENFGESIVSQTLLNKYLSESELLKKAYEFISSDEEFNSLLDMSNIIAVKRLKYNDHGPVHARIVAGAGLDIFRRLVSYGVQPTTLVDKTTSNLDEAALVVMLGALLHDIGNSVHRIEHEFIGSIILTNILDRILKELFPNDRRKQVFIRQEVSHVVYSTNSNVESLSIEAGCVKVADGTDMSEGRARFPYKLGKNDIHAVSALSVEKVSISSDSSSPVVITVHMKEMAGLFQIEQVLYPKIKTSGIKDYVKMKAICCGRELKLDYR